MHKKMIPLVTVGLTVGCTTTAAVTTNTEITKPNIIFMMIDDLGWRDLSTGKTNLGHGSTYYETKNVDRMANKGMSFTNAYSCGPNCAPSRGALFSGQYSPRTKMYTVKSCDRGGKKVPLKGPENAQHLSLEVVTFAECLQKAGYTCGHFGKWHVGGHTGGGLPTQQGFDVNIGGNNVGGSVAGFFANKDGAFKAKKGKPQMPNLGPNGKAGQWLDDRVTEEVLKYMEASKQKPFMVNFCFYAVHSPNSSPKDDKAYFDGKKKDKYHNNQTYAGFVKSYDDNIGRLMDYLETTDDPRNPGHKLIANTVVMFTSDNGGCGGWVKPRRDSYSVTSQYPLRNGKGSLNEGGIRVPLIIRWDGKVKADTQSSQTVGTIDFYPTFLELAGAEVPENQILDGESLIPLLTAKQRKLNREAFYWHFPAYLSGRAEPSSAIRQGDYKVIYWYETNSWELYNVETDLHEATNLAKDKPELLKKMANNLIKWLKETGADMPTNKKTGKVVFPRL